MEPTLKRIMLWKQRRVLSVWSVAKLCLTLCDLVAWRPPGSSVHGVLQARILEWVAISFSRGSPWPRAGTQGSLLSGKESHCRWVIRETNTQMCVLHVNRYKHVSYIQMVARLETTRKNKGDWFVSIVRAKFKFIELVWPWEPYSISCNNL